MVLFLVGCLTQVWMPDEGLALKKSGAELLCLDLNLFAL